MLRHLPLLTRIGLGVLGRGQRLALETAARRFRAALRTPRRAQLERLRTILGAQATTAYGAHYGFGRIRDVRDFQDRVPIVDYDDLLPWVSRMERGERGVLVAGPVRAFERSSGSNGPSKLIPMTAGLLSEFHEATSAWVHDLLTRVPEMMGTTSYWSVSPGGPRGERSSGGVPIGLEDDTEYLGPLARLATRWLLAVPAAVSRIESMEALRYVTARCLLGSPHLGLISVWSPTFFTLLLEAAERHMPQLARDIEQGTLSPPAPLPPGLFLGSRRPDPSRAALLRTLWARRGRLEVEQVWPRLRLVSCWTSATSARFVPELQRRLGQVPIQPKGLLATEGVVSVPLWGHAGAALAVTSHFLEFQEVAASDARPNLAHELETGREYVPLLTTSGGLYRYRLPDRVRVVGQLAETPLVEFVGRLDGGVDLVGEKLTPARIEGVLRELCAALGCDLRFALLAPETRPEGPPRYVLYAEPGFERTTGLPAAASECLDGLLRQGHHYDRCRALGQLGPPAVVLVSHGAERYEAACVARGARAGDVKPACLHPAEDWALWMRALGAHR